MFLGLFFCYSKFTKTFAIFPNIQSIKFRRTHVNINVLNMKDSILQKNPFSLYDFLGYFFPGAFFLLTLLAIFHTSESAVSELTLKSIVGYFQGEVLCFNFEKSIYFIVTSYIIGHILSYLSSITIERFSLWMFGYPSEFLMGQKQKCNYWNRVVTNCGSKSDTFCPFCSEFSAYTYLKKILLRLLIGIFHIPILLMYFFFSLFSLREFIIKPLDEYTQNCIHENIMKLETLLGHVQTESDVDYSRLIYHYYARKSSLFLSKVDNYVALYGFLRSSCLAFNSLTIIILVISLLQSNFLQNAIFIVILAFVSFLLFLAFMKFYRRYSLEIFMFLISDDDLNIRNHLDKVENIVKVGINL